MISLPELTAALHKALLCRHTTPALSENSSLCYSDCYAFACYYYIRYGGNCQEGSQRLR